MRASRSVPVLWSAQREIAAAVSHYLFVQNGRRKGLWMLLRGSLFLLLPAACASTGHYSASSPAGETKPASVTTVASQYSPSAPVPVSGLATIPDSPVATPVVGSPVSPAAKSSTMPTVATYPACAKWQLVFTLSTPQPSYPSGESIAITGTLRNTGGTCQDTALETGGCWSGAFVASNERQQVVWQDFAQRTNMPDVSNCPEEPASGTTVPAHWSEIVTRNWDQTSCVFDPDGQPLQPNPDCSNAQVHVGTYSITDTRFDGSTAFVEITSS